MNQLNSLHSVVLSYYYNYSTSIGPSCFIIIPTICSAVCYNNRTIEIR